MPLVATFVCAPALPALTDALLRQARALLPGASTVDWLDPGIAADVTFAGNLGETAHHAAMLQAALAPHPVDIIVQGEDNRRKQLLLADMDSTMIGQECIDELADCIGEKAQVAAITEAAMRGEIAFEPALRARVALLAGLDVQVIAKVLRERIVPMPGGRTLVSTMKAHGAKAVLVSGGFTAFTAAVAEQFGFDAHQANMLIVTDGRFSGTVAEPILGRAAKREALIAWREKLGLPASATLAVGDGANDLDMLAAAGLGVAFHAKPAVSAAAHARIAHGDLTALLYLQGYRGADFVDGT